MQQANFKSRTYWDAEPKYKNNVIQINEDGQPRFEALDCVAYLILLRRDSARFSMSGCVCHTVWLYMSRQDWQQRDTNHQTQLRLVTMYHNHSRPIRSITQFFGPFFAPKACMITSISSNNQSRHPMNGYSAKITPESTCHTLIIRVVNLVW